jgi:hypothetical protein
MDTVCWRFRLNKDQVSKVSYISLVKPSRASVPYRMTDIMPFARLRLAQPHKGFRVCGQYVPCVRTENATEWWY